ncbi:MAG: hypothetical protein J6P28_01060 [Treponema sp.]|nr:hypothetical protein [Treponema sp.]
MANSTGQAFAPPPFRPSLTLIPPFGRYCRGSMAAYDPKKSLRGFFWVLQKCFALLHAAKRPSMGFLFVGKYEEKPSMDFPRYCRIAVQFCMLLSRHPWLGNGWQATKNLHGFLRDCRIAAQFCMLLSRPSMGFLFVGKYEEKSILGFSKVLQNRCAILHVAKPPSMAL